MENNRKGFTLIELLVVIAIIGILASIIITNLSSEKNKASNASVISELKSAQSQANVYGDETDGNYSGICTDPEFQRLTDAARLSYDKTGGTLVVCTGNSSAWAAYVPLKAPITGAGWCVDSTGTAKASAALLPGNTVCP